MLREFSRSDADGRPVRPRADVSSVPRQQRNPRERANTDRSLAIDHGRSQTMEILSTSPIFATNVALLLGTCANPCLDDSGDAAMGLESAPFAITDTRQPPLPCCEVLPDTFAAPYPETLEGRDRETAQTTLDRRLPELMALQEKALHSIQLCQQTIVDFIGALQDGDKWLRHRAGTTTDQVSCVGREVSALEAFFNSARNFIVCLADAESANNSIVPGGGTGGRWAFTH